METHAVIHYAAAIGFLTVVVFHLLRIINGWQLTFRGNTYPIWLSVVEAGIALILALLLIWSAKV